jgi:hypothetical protein
VRMFLSEGPTAAFIIIDLADKRKVKCSCGIGTVTVLLQSINRDAGILRIGSIFMAHAVVLGVCNLLGPVLLLCGLP